MIALFRRIFSRPRPVVADANSMDAASIAALHGMSFQRGWSEAEVESLLLDRNVVTHRALAGKAMAGFIMSRLAADEAEILSVAVAHSWRGRGIGRDLLMWHLGRLAGRGSRIVFLEVDENNDAAVRLYVRAGFRKISRRPNYYPRTAGPAAAALVLRRDLG